MVYFDDILIYSHTTRVLFGAPLNCFYTLKKEYLYVNQKKCKFFTDIVVFFGFIVYVDSVQADQSKIYVIVE